MKPLRLRIVLDQPGRRGRIGDRIRGRVEIESTDAIECRMLDIVASWWTEGELNSSSDAVDMEFHPMAPLAGGEQRSVPFSLALPAEAPPSYEGRNFSIVWKVSASLDAPGTEDHEVTESFFVSPPENPVGTLVQEGDSGRFDAGLAWACGLIALGTSALATKAPEWRTGLIVTLIVGVPTLLLGLRAMTRAMAARRLGRGRIEAGPLPVARGEELAVSLTLRPERRVEGATVRATLTCSEVGAKGVGEGAKYTSEVVARSAAVLNGPKVLEPGQEAVFAGMVDVPIAAGPSLQVSSVQVAWSLSVEVESPGRPDVSWNAIIQVV